MSEIIKKANKGFFRSKHHELKLKGRIRRGFIKNIQGEKVSSTTNKNLNKSNTHYLWWLNEQSGKRLPAGVAFYEEEYGEYRLKLDALPEIQYYLKSVGAEGERIKFRVEVILKKNGKFAGRRAVGDGYAYPNQGPDIKVDIGPFCKTLTLTMRQ